MKMRGRENSSGESIDVSQCMTNDLGRLKLGLASEEEIGELIERRTSVGTRGRSRYGPLACELAGCEAVCNVEIKDGILVEKNM